MEQTSRIALLVEDAPLFRKMMGEYLRQLGFTDISEASSGRAAIQALEQRRPDLVCLDLVLPDVSGYDLCEYIRGSPALSDVPVLMISARGLPEDRASAEEVGASGYLCKPFTQAEFQRHVEQVMARAATPAVAEKGR
jgi:two-component system chemotaxis response regulator CheY